MIWKHIVCCTIQELILLISIHYFFRQHHSITATTSEVCVGVVKAATVHEKCPAQHVADLEMLESMDKLHPVFFKLLTNLPKSIECI